jgi:hypothetical protein
LAELGRREIVDKFLERKQRKGDEDYNKTVKEL